MSRFIITSYRLADSRVGVTAPIVGTSSLDNLQDLLGAVDLKLTEEEMKELSEPYEAQAAFGQL